MERMMREDGGGEGRRRKGQGQGQGQGQLSWVELSWVGIYVEDVDVEDVVRVRVRFSQSYAMQCNEPEW